MSDIPSAWDLLERANARCNDLASALGSAVGHMMNARIDLETGETKAHAIRTLTRGIEIARKPLDELEARVATLKKMEEALAEVERVA